MERNEFIKSLGLGLALVCTGACFEACKKTEPTGTTNPPGTPGTGTTVSVDLTQQLANVGSSFKTGGVLFIRVATGNQPSSFVATEAVCPHAGGALNWTQANIIQCTLHSAQYQANGTVLQQPNGGGSTRNLKIYNVSVSGNTLTATVA